MTATTFRLRGLNSFFVGAESVHLDLPPTGNVALAMGSAARPLQQAGDYETGQMYVQGFLGAEDDTSLPLMMWHGGGMTGVTWETTPDGRPGWLELALRDGFDVYVSDATILSHADPDDEDGDGISGRANNDAAGLGRLGTKAQANNIELFTRAPLFNQMGVTTNPLQGSAGTVSLGHSAGLQGSSTPNAPTFDNDGVADPEMSAGDLGDLIAFSRFLAPPEPQPFNDAAARGEALFDAVGCAKCHVPELPSTRGPVRAFTDLLLHDMGPDLAGEVSFGTPQMGANDPPTTEAEWRTAPLWGVGSAAPYLHDGRASTLEDAILWHGGEALGVRDAFSALSAQERADVIEFLRHL